MDQIKITLTTSFGYTEEDFKVVCNRILFNLKSNLFEFSVEGSHKIDQGALVVAMQNKFPITLLCSLQETNFKLFVNKNNTYPDTIILFSLEPLIYTPKEHIDVPHYVLNMLKICDQMMIHSLDTMCCLAHGER